MAGKSLFVVCLVDESGSMRNQREDVIGGLNKLISEHRDSAVPVFFTLAFFSDTRHFRYHCQFQPMRQVLDLTSLGYDPDYNTALRDAFGRVLDDAQKLLANICEEDRPGRVLVVVQTDGGENNSCQVTQQALMEKIATLRATGTWEFLFLGADVDAFAMQGGAGSLGFASSSVANYSKSANGVRNSYEGVSEGLKCYASNLAAGRAADMSLLRDAVATHTQSLGTPEPAPAPVPVPTFSQLAAPSIIGDLPVSAALVAEAWKAVQTPDQMAERLKQIVAGAEAGEDVFDAAVAWGQEFIQTAQIKPRGVGAVGAPKTDGTVDVLVKATADGGYEMVLDPSGKTPVGSGG
jgi:hypothetical protein